MNLTVEKYHRHHLDQMKKVNGIGNDRNLYASQCETLRRKKHHFCGIHTKKVYPGSSHETQIREAQKKLDKITELNSSKCQDHEKLRNYILKETKQTLQINTMDDSGLDLEPERKGEKGSIFYYYSFT